MDTTAVLRALAAAGLSAWPDSAGSFLTDGGERLFVTARSRPHTPNDIERDLLRAGPDKMLYHVRTLTPSVRDAVRRDRRLVVFVSDTGALWLDGEERGPRRDRKPSVPRGRKPFTQYALVRSLLLDPRPRRQVDFARETGSSQPAVSTALKGLETGVEHRRAGTVTTDWAALWDFYSDRYPGTGGITTYWWHDAPLDDQIGRLTTHAARRGITCLVSGDLGARRVAPWRQPEHATLYLAAGVDPGQAGFALAGPDDHTLSITVPEDTTVFATAAAHGMVAGHADPVLIAYDVERAGTTGDQGEAAGRVRDRVRSLWDEAHP